MEKIVTIEGKEMRMRVDALIPRLYRNLLGRDMMRDIKSYEDAEKKDGNGDLSIFEDAVWVALKHAGEDVGDKPEDWLCTLSNMFAVYEIMPTFIDMWRQNQKTTSVPRKK